MKMQHEIGEDNCIKVTFDMDEGGCENVTDTKRNWIKSIIHCQKIDKGGYGAWFPAVPSYQSNDRDSRVLWLLSGMIVCVKELWCLTDNVNMHVSKWHGWLLAYLTRFCFPEIVFKNDTTNPIMRKYVSTIPKLLNKMGLEEGIGMLDYHQLGEMFDDHEHVCVLYNSVFSNTNTLEGNINCDDQVVIILHDAYENDYVIPEVVTSHGMIYELHFITCTIDMDGDFKWDGEMYCRHGMEHHRSWWIQKR